jgi:hypothetical protein
MKIQHYKRSNIAQAPDELSDCINKYSEHQSFVSFRELDNSKPFDIVHYHNRMWQGEQKPNGAASIMQYHSPPKITDVNKYNGPELVVAQYQATLEDYARAFTVRNIINFENNPLYDFHTGQKIQIVYSPTVVRNEWGWVNKGYSQTIAILEEIKKARGVDIDIITGVSLNECLERKQKATIVIDECITGSYHRSSLEGLAAGKVTIAYMNPQVERLFLKVSKSNTLPINNTPIDALKTQLNLLIDKGLAALQEEGWKNWEWMRAHWHPQDIVDQYVEFYKFALSNPYEEVWRDKKRPAPKPHPKLIKRRKAPIRGSQPLK